MSQGPRTDKPGLNEASKWGEYTAEDRPREGKGDRKLKVRTIKGICLIITKKDVRENSGVLTVG